VQHGDAGGWHLAGWDGILIGGIALGTHYAGKADGKRSKDKRQQPLANVRHRHDFDLPAASEGRLRE